MLILFLLFLIQFSIACACLAVNAKQQEQLAEQVIYTFYYIIIHAKSDKNILHSLFLYYNWNVRSKDYNNFIFYFNF